MAHMLKMSEAASLAIHTMVILAANTRQRLSAREIAAMLASSEAHLAKVLQRLAKVELVSSLRGPKGGFRLLKPAEDITLLEVYEAIEGTLDNSTCLLHNPICDGKCIFGGMLKTVNKQVHDYMATTRLPEFAATFAKDEAPCAER